MDQPLSERGGKAHRGPGDVETRGAVRRVFQPNYPTLVRVGNPNPGLALARLAASKSFRNKTSSSQTAFITLDEQTQGIAFVARRLFVLLSTPHTTLTR